MARGERGSKLLGALLQGPVLASEIQGFQDPSDGIQYLRSLLRRSNYVLVAEWCYTQTSLGLIKERRYFLSKKEEYAVSHRADVEEVS